MCNFTVFFLHIHCDKEGRIFLAKIKVSKACEVWFFQNHFEAESGKNKEIIILHFFGLQATHTFLTLLLVRKSHVVDFTKGKATTTMWRVVPNQFVSHTTKYSKQKFGGKNEQKLETTKK